MQLTEISVVTSRSLLWQPYLYRW